MKIKSKITSFILITILLILTIIPINVFALNRQEKLANADKIGGYLVQELGLNVNVAFGILGNIEAESGFDPAIIEFGYTENTGGCGICQWTNCPRTSSSGRRTNMINTAGTGGRWKTNLDGQLEYLKKELTGSYKHSVLDRLKSLPDNEKGRHEAADIWCRYFEIPADMERTIQVRKNNADKLYKDLDGKLSGYTSGSGIQDYSFVQEILAPTSNISLTDGSILSTTPEEKEERLKINTEILQSTSREGGSGGTTYSLYERFGPKLQFIEYLGEITENIELADHIVSAVTEDKINNIKITDDVLFYESHIYLSTVVYKDRPPALDVEMLRNGYLDTRVETYKTNHTGKLFALIHAKYLLAISTFIVGTVNLFIDNHFFVFILDIFKSIVQSDFWKAVETGVNFILIFFLVAFLISLIKHAIGFARGKEPALLFFTRAAIGIFSIGLVGLFIAHPADLLDDSAKVINFADSLVNENIATVYQDDPVIYSENGEYTMQAMVWETALFDPWCKALFGKPYDKLYTQYAEVPDDQKLKQSYEPDHDNPVNNTDAEIFYDSAGCTGDVFVDLGGGKLERNWAAYALSTMSIYHIGHEVYEEEEEVDTSDFDHFPMAKTSHRDKNLYADTFRWIDAKMNISPQYFIDDEEGASFNNYGESRDFTTHYYRYSWEMFWKALLLACLIPVIVLRLKAFLGMLYVTVKGIYYSLVELIKENQGLSAFWDDLKEHFFNYIYRSIQLYILLFLYTSLVQKSFFFHFLYIALCILLSTTSIRDLGFRVKHIVKDIKHFATS